MIDPTASIFNLEQVWRRSAIPRIMLLKDGMRTGSPGIFAIAAIVVSMAGCAHTYVDEQGSRHVIGLVWAKLPSPAFDIAADSLRVRAIGISTTKTLAGSAIVLGYSDSNIVVVRDNQLVDAAPLLGKP